MAEDEDLSLPWSTPASRLKYDVFINFRGADTRESFALPLHAELEKCGIRPFLDDEGLRQGESLDPILFEAIDDSGAAIAIISRNYASSRWCLEELARICESRRLVLPVFYEVDPSDVRRQKGPFEAHFRGHEEKFGKEVVGRWRNAMAMVGKLKGRVFNQSDNKSLLIQSLVRDIKNELSNTPEFVAPCIVGLEKRMEELIRLLNPISKGIVIIGLYGMGGIGKTTLAKALYNKLIRHFECRSFISNVRESSARDDGFGLVAIQSKLIKDLFGETVPQVDDIESGRKAINKKLPTKPVLVILDDVDKDIQLKALLGKRDFLCEGSRIIICTRDRQVLSPTLVNMMYEVKQLDFSDSMKLFSYHAFRKEKPLDTFANLSNKIVRLTGQLPLALEVFGSLLFDKRSIDKWEDMVKKLRTVRPGDLQNVLKISFDGLDVEVKCIFLDLACILLELGLKKDEAIEVLEGCGFSAKVAISVLIQRSLVKVREDNELWMHDQLKDMGREIVLEEDRVDAGRRSRLWDLGEIMGVLQDGKGSSNVEGIVLEAKRKKDTRIMTARELAMDNMQRRLNLFSTLAYLMEMYKGYFQQSEEGGGEKIIQTKPFKTMTNLRLLQLRNVKLEGDFRNLPAKLKWLQWKECPLKRLPSTCPRELAVLDLSESKIKDLWISRRWWWFNSKVAENLMIMNLHGCYNITSIPDLSGYPNLKKLNLKRCKMLSKIHKSIGDLTLLSHLNLEDCSSLEEFPSNVSGLKSLTYLNLSGCSLLKKLPEDLSCMKSLIELLVERTSIKKLPESIIRLQKLERLHLSGCISLNQLPMGIGSLVSLKELFLDDTALEELPHSIGSLNNLKELSLRRCELLFAIPDSVGNLKSLTDFWLNGSAVREIPASISSVHYLKSLSVSRCRGMTMLPVSIGQLASMVELQLDETPITLLPDQIGGLKSLRKLEMRKCESLRSLPESIGDIFFLETLIICNAAIEELPESIGKLENLVMLNLNECELLCCLPDSLGNLKSLHHLLMEKTAVSKLPESFGSLSNLMILKIGKMPWLEVPESPEPKPVKLPNSFSKLSLLQDFDARAWRISGNIPEDFVSLTSLETLNLSHNNFTSLPSGLKRLAFLRELELEHCKELKSLPELPSSLVKLNAANCTELESIKDLSNLEGLKELNLANCGKLVDLPGLECLKSLTWLHMIGCISCSTDVKEKLSKLSLRNLHSLYLPGRAVPDWFTPSAVSFTKRKNLAIKAVLVVAIVSVNHQIRDDLRDQLPVLPCIEAQILRLERQVYSTTLHLAGVPKTDEDQFYLCRYHEYHPLVSILRDGDEIQVVMKNPPIVQGVELKRSGIHLVFENDDDYEEDEEMFDENFKSASERLARDIKSSDDRSMQETEASIQERFCCMSVFRYLCGF